MNYLEQSQQISHLLVVEDIKGRRTITLDQMKYCIGRHSSNHIVIYSQQASRFHATLVRRKNNQTNSYSYWIVDGDLEGNKSYNGIYINGKKSLVYELKDGDLINFGCEVNASYHQSKPSLVVEFLPLGDSPSKNTSVADTLADEKSYLDEVTKLPNKNLYKEYLSIAVNNAVKSQKSLAIIMFAIDELELRKNKYSPETTNKLLLLFGERLKSSIRSGDIVFYWEDNQFVVLLPAINNIEDIDKINARIFNYLDKPLVIDHQPITLKISSGFSLYPNQTEDSKNLISIAEESLHKRKQSQKNLNNNTKSKKLSQIEELLSNALDRKEFILYYQPQVNISTRKLKGLEALLRWDNPKYGVISPNKFLAFAEETELIIPLTDWVIKTACEQSNIWKSEGLSLPSLGINISTGYFKNSNFLDKILPILSKANLSLNVLELELTEESLLKDMKSSQKNLSQLHELGIKITLDDFGLGYSSIACLNQLPIQKLKIAQSLISSLIDNSKNIALVKAAIALGNALQIEVVAEGVETQQQLDILQSLGCTEMQGNHFSKPLPVDQATQFLRLHLP